MGNNVNLCDMLNAPKTADCQVCWERVKTHFDDYDIDCGNPNPAPGKWRLRYYCSRCEHESYWECVVRSSADEVYVMFDGPPSHAAGRFVEVETTSGTSAAVPWSQRGEYWALGPFYRPAKEE